MVSNGEAAIVVTVFAASGGITTNALETITPLCGNLYPGNILDELAGA
jgi:hypothetical protein